MRLAAYGDILMATPLLSALRSAYPTAHITWIVERHQADTISANPEIDELLLWEGRYWKRLLRRGLAPIWLACGIKFIRQLNSEPWDIFISLQPEEWPLLTQMIKSPVKVGIFDTFRRFYRAKKTSSNTRLFTHPYTVDDLPLHRTDQYLFALKALRLQPDVNKKMTLGITAQDQKAADQFLVENGLNSRNFVVMAPCATWVTRCWDERCFIELGNRLASDGCRVVVIGSAKEKDAVGRVVSGLDRPPAISDGGLTFRQTAAIIDRASLLVSGDTGPMHAAAALGTPYTALFGATSPEWYGPLSGGGLCLSHPVPCGPCDQKTCSQEGEKKLRCLNLITVDTAYAACAGLTEAHDV